MASKRTWKANLQKACISAGTYRQFFESVIDTLAEILEQRDTVEKEYKKSKDGPIVEYTNKNGSTNKVKNPLLVVWNDLNNTALSYFRELGLTPSGLKKIDESAMKKKKKSSLAAALEELGG